jgi:ABC-type phosphate/phosphonate transport system permease subunit
MDVPKFAPAELSGRPRKPRSEAQPKRLASFILFLVFGLAFCMLCLSVAEVSIPRLLEGLPRLVGWVARSWPPDVSEIDVLAYRGLKTVAMATVGVSFGAVIAAPLCLLAARNVGVATLAAPLARWLLLAPSSACLAWRFTRPGRSPSSGPRQSRRRSRGRLSRRV